MRLRPKLILAFLVVVLICVGGLGVIVENLIRRSLERSAQEILEHDLQMAWVEYYARGQQIRYGMQQAASESFIQEMVRQKKADDLRALLRTWLVYRPYVDFWLVTDPEGRVIARINSDQTGDATPFNELVVEAAARGEPIISTEILPQSRLLREGLITPGGDDALVAVVATPVVCDGAAVCGVIVAGDLLNGDAHIPLGLRQKLHGHANHATVGEELHGPIVFISRGTIIVSTSLRDPGSSTLSDWQVEAALAPVTTGLAYRGTLFIQGVPFLTAADPIHNERGEVVGALMVGLPEQDFWALSNEAVRAIILILSGGVTLAMGMAAVLSHRLTRPLQELTEKAQAIAQGNLSVRARLSREDEIGDLGRAFDRMAQQLQQSYDEISQERRKVLAAIEASRDAIWISDASQHIVMMNSALERLTGHNRAALIGHSCHNLLRARLRDGQPICETVCPFRHPNEDSTGTIEGFIPTVTGKDVWIEISYGRVMDPDQRLVSVIHIVRDLTHRKEVERLKDEFLSMVTHELRTPLHHIKGFATTLLQTDVQWDIPTQRDFLETINRESDRLTNLVEKILHLSRLEAGGLPMEKDWHRVNDLVNGALQRQRDLIADREVRVRMPSNLPALFVDGREIEVVLANLMANAAKYSEPGTEIVLEAEQQDGRIVFTVADQGIGISPEHQKRIFEKFYREDRVARRVPGIGLGLAICKRIVEAHGGHIWVESAPGSGARFFFDLPLD